MSFAHAACASRITTCRDLKTQDGIADVGFAWMSWIIDPGKNALAIVQRKP